MLFLLKISYILGEYDQNLCPRTSLNCIVCPKRLPSCRGLSDGIQPVPSEMWGDRYLTCLQNRTLAVTKCPRSSVFDPVLLQCRENVPFSKLYLVYQKTRRNCLVELCKLVIYRCLKLKHVRLFL